MQSPVPEPAPSATWPAPAPAAGQPTAPRPPRIPFIVVGGFLGAGKTTLLNRWLAEAPEGQRIAVLVNDFGAINIDAALVARRGADSIALTNCCVCCSIGDDLSQALTALLAARPGFDAIVVEASGVSDPWRIAQYALVDPGLSLAAVVVLVDAAAVLAQVADPLLTSSLVQPLAHADLVMLNKADLADAPTLAAVRAWVAGHAGSAVVMPSTQADLPLAALADLGGHQSRGGWPHGAQGQAREQPHDQRFEAFSLRPGDAVYDEPLLRAWLRQLPPGVLRAKGLLRSAQRGWLLLQYAGRHGSLQPAPADAAQALGGAALVAIGLRGRLPVQALAQGLAGCVVAPDNGQPSAPETSCPLPADAGLSP